MEVKLRTILTMELDTDDPSDVSSGRIWVPKRWVTGWTPESVWQQTENFLPAMDPKYYGPIASQFIEPSS
jgi:hypothetical protein